MSKEKLPGQPPEMTREARDQRILELTGIEPVSPHDLSTEETKALIEGVQRREADAMETLVASRLAWIYDKYVNNENIRTREDLGEADILQIGSLAVLEAARTLDAENPNFKALHFIRARRSIVGQIMDAKLLHTISEKGHKLTNARYAHEEGRMREAILPVGNRGDVAAAGQGTGNDDEMPEQALQILEGPSNLTRAMDALDEVERSVIEARFGLGEFDEDEPGMSRADIGKRLGLNREVVRKTEIRALEELRRAYESLTDPQGARSAAQRQGDLQEKWLEEVRRKPDAGGAAAVTGDLLARQQEVLRQRWFEEIGRKQAAGKIAFVTGSLLEGELPEPILFYLLTDYEGKYDPPAPSVDFKEALRQAGMEEFRARRLTSASV